MITLPISDLLLLPGVTFFFKKDVFPSGEITAESVGEDILFIMEKEEKEQMTPDNFYPIGVIGTIDSVDEEGNVRVKVRERVQISDTEMGKDGVITADASILPDVDDFPKEEEKALFEKMKQDILRFVKGFPWGVWARGVILHWKNVEEIGCALSSYFNITWEEKYGIIETDSRRERCKKIEEAVYEFMEIFHVGEEAEEAQKEIHEQGQLWKRRQGNQQIRAYTKQTAAHHELVKIDFITEFSIKRSGTSHQDGESHRSCQIADRFAYSQTFFRESGRPLADRLLAGSGANHHQ